MPVNITQEEQSKLAAELLNENIQVNNNVTKASNISNPKSYLISPGKVHGNYSYPDLLVSMTRLGYDNEVDRAAKKLNLTLQNTAAEQTTNQGYIGKINWHSALKLNLTLDSFTLNIRQYLDFLNLLKSGKAFYGDGSKADKKVLNNLLDEISTVRDPWRAEWLDADFKVKDDKLYINYNHKLDNNKLKPQKTELLEECILEDRTPGINLDNFLMNATSQGLPKKNVKTGDLYYYAPDKDNNSVARFGAGSDRAGLYCFWDPSDSGSVLGVRRAKIKG